MIQTGQLDVSADRWVPFVRILAFVDFNFDGADFSLQVRDRPDGGTVRATLATVGSIASEGVKVTYAGEATVQEHIAYGRLSAVPRNLLPSTSIWLSQVYIRINESTMETMPYPAERGDDIALWWDLHITPSLGIKDKYIGGKFVVRAGVTE